MALPDLASVADLSARGIDTSNAERITKLLKVASATVRRAAGSPILSTVSTVTLWATGDSGYLDLPGQPITAVSLVTHDGDTLPAGDYKVVDGKLWRAGGWGYSSEPMQVTVTLTHGHPEVPADIVDLACSLVGAGLAAADEGHVGHNGKVAEMVGDYQVTYTRGAEAVATAMTLPPATRRWLRSTFGGGAGMVNYT